MSFRIWRFQAVNCANVQRETPGRPRLLGQPLKQSKPVERRGRKVTGLKSNEAKAAGLPESEVDRGSFFREASHRQSDKTRRSAIVARSSHSFLVEHQDAHTGKRLHEGNAMTQFSVNTKRVVSLNGLGRTRSPGQRILNECRDQLVSGLCNWLREVATAVSEELFVLADSTRERLQQTRYLDLRADIEKDWPHFVETFRRELSAESERSQDNAWQQGEKSESPLDIPDFEGLQLMDDADLSEHIVIREFSAQLSETCDGELYTLNRRVAALLGHEERNDEADNPLAPPVICRSLTDACATISANSESRLILLRRLERHLHGVLPDIYRKINAYLIERGILQDLKRTYQRNIATGKSTSADTDTATSTTSEQPAGSFSPPISGESILEALQRIAQARSALPGQTGIFGTMTGSGSPLAGVSNVTGAITNQAAASLDSATINQLLLASLNELQHAPTGEPGGVIINQVKLVRDSEGAKQANGLEAVTMDIVTMLFDLIFDDARIPLAIKALISRLQIPVLKVAMLNPGFFAERQHPTRRFLSSISGIAIRWGNSVDESDPFYGKMAELVDRIQAEFEEDIEIFGVALEELESFVDEREAEEDETALAAANIVIKHEIEAEGWERAQHAIRAFLKDTPQPAVLEDFLAEHWVAVLQKIVVGDAETQAEWASATEVMKDLAWSIAPKKSSDDRLKLIGLLPRLLATLNKGLDRTEIAPAQRAAFFDALVKFHSAALKGEMTEQTTPPTVLPAEQFSPPAAPAEGDLLVTRTIDNGVQVEEVILVGASPVWHPGDRDIFQQVNELCRGDWVEFIEDDGNTNRERLNWISPQRGILLFSNHRSAKAISITPDALARQIRDGKATIVLEDAIFERALNGALESINAE